MRVLQVLPGVVAGGGAEQSLVMVAPHLAAGGIEVHLAVLSDRQSTIDQLERVGVVVHDLSGPRGMVDQARRLRATLSRIKPAVLHSTLWDADLPARLASFRSGVPLLTTWASTTYSADRRRLEDGVAPWKRDVVRRIDSASSKLARSWYHAVTQGVADDGIGALGVDPDRVRVVERGRDLSRFERRSAATRAAARSALGVEPHQQVVLTVARQAHQKDHVGLLAAFDQVADRFPDAQLLLVGPRGTASAAIDAVLATMKHSDRVRDLGERNDVERVLPAADVYVMSSIAEGAAGAVIEAMAVGLPVAATEVEGLRGVLAHDVNARLCPPGDRDGLAAAISDLLADGTLADRLGAQAAADAERRFEIGRQAAALAELYREVAATGANSKR
jgi:glycosyltransferase involved in cell wall biosynthesis